MARSIQRTVPERMKDALRRVEGRVSIVAMTRTQAHGVRDPLGVRPLVIGKVGDGWGFRRRPARSTSSARSFVREGRAGRDGGDRAWRVEVAPALRAARRPRFLPIFEHVYFSRPDSILGGQSVY